MLLNFANFYIVYVVFATPEQAAAMQQATTKTSKTENQHISKRKQDNRKAVKNFSDSILE